VWGWWCEKVSVRERGGQRDWCAVLLLKAVVCSATVLACVCEMLPIALVLVCSGIVLVHCECVPLSLFIASVYSNNGQVNKIILK